MKTPSILLAALLLLSAASAYADDAATIKLQCRVGNLDVGPLELNLKSGIAYRFFDRTQYQITSVVGSRITFWRAYGIGGDVSVLDALTGRVTSSVVRWSLSEGVVGVTATSDCTKSMIE
jgi:hypothetical protein